MTYSLNEIETLAKRAARGAGYDWGLCEEAGKAVRWLSARGMGGAQALWDLLRAKETGQVFAPTEGLSVWANPKGDLCPLITGAGLCDFAPATNMALQCVSSPLLLLPFAARLAAQDGRCRKIKIRDFLAMTSGGEVWADGQPTKMSDVVIDIVPDVPDYTPVTPRERGEMSEDVFEALNAFAHRGFAPATEESRLAGAGSGLSDND